jgi:wyosine [tRNA(Phe)-imidazoG37] synthetase (radical SAM superfamily)
MTRYLLGLQKGIIYGPINSRRLGASLGLNILPTQYKACPFNCVYCQYGYTRRAGHLVESDGRDMPLVNEVADALEEALEEYPAVSYITFSGNGEPTLHPDFAEIVDAVKEIRNRLAPHARVAVLSNSALVHRKKVRMALAKLDVRHMKLDAGDEETFKRFNRPRKEIKYEEIVASLMKMKDIHIQALFAGGQHGNCSDSHVERWIERIGEIKPVECHIYSIDRPIPDRKLVLIGREGLLKIKQRAEDVGTPVKIYQSCA